MGQGTEIVVAQNVEYRRETIEIRHNSATCEGSCCPSASVDCVTKIDCQNARLNSPVFDRETHLVQGIAVRAQSSICTTRIWDVRILHISNESDANGWWLR